MKRHQRGIALVMVLWGITLLSLMAAGLAQSGGLAARRMSHAVEHAQARAMLDEALTAAAIALLDPDPLRRWLPDGTAHEISVGPARAQIRASAAAGRVDLNGAPPPLLKNLFRMAVGEAESADRLMAAFLVANQPGQGGRPFLSVAELAGLPGMTGPAYHLLAERATVHNPSGRLAWRLASDKVLALIPGLDTARSAALLAARKQSSYIPDLTTAQAFAAAGVTDEAVFSPLVVTLDISLTLPGQAIASGEMLVQLQSAGRPVLKILEWREPSWREEGR